MTQADGNPSDGIYSVFIIPWSLRKPNIRPRCEDTRYRKQAIGYWLILPMRKWVYILYAVQWTLAMPDGHTIQYTELKISKVTIIEASGCT